MHIPTWLFHQFCYDTLLALLRVRDATQFTILAGGKTSLWSQKGSWFVSSFFLLVLGRQVSTLMSHATLRQFASSLLLFLLCRNNFHGAFVRTLQVFQLQFNSQDGVFGRTHFSGCSPICAFLFQGDKWLHFYSSQRVSGTHCGLTGVTPLGLVCHLFCSVPQIPPWCGESPEL